MNPRYKVVIKYMTSLLRSDGILLILWGWVLFYGSFKGYLERSLLIPSSLASIINVIGIAFQVSCVMLTVYYVFSNKQQAKTRSGLILLYVWLSLCVELVLVNLILYNVLQSINFELQHPLFMLLMAMAVTTTGAILQYRLVIIGGVIFGLLALLASYFQLEEQLLIESIAWTIAFLIPGIIVYYNNWKSTRHRA